MIKMIENNIIPVIPSQGSVGSSGDLVQLSHLVLAMIGKGRVYVPKDIEKENIPEEKIISSINFSNEAVSGNFSVEEFSELVESAILPILQRLFSFVSHFYQFSNYYHSIQFPVPIWLAS